VKKILHWAFRPQTQHTNLDMILHIEDDYYYYSYKPSKELSRFYLAQV